MLNMLKRFWQEEDGLGTVEIVVIIAVLVGLALIFRQSITSFVVGVINRMFKTGDNAIENLQQGEGPTFQPSE